MAPEAAWRPQESGVHQICYLLAQVQKPGTDQGQVNTPFWRLCMPAWRLGGARGRGLQICCHIRPGRQASRGSWALEGLSTLSARNYSRHAGSSQGPGAVSGGSPGQHQLVEGSLLDVLSCCCADSAAAGPVQELPRLQQLPGLHIRARGQLAYRGGAAGFVHHCSKAAFRQLASAGVRDGL